MKNSENTIKLFDEVMDYFDSLSPEEFIKEINKSKDGEIANLFHYAGYFLKDENKPLEITPNTSWTYAEVGGIHSTGKSDHSHASSFLYGADVAYASIADLVVNSTAIHSAWIQSIVNEKSIPVKQLHAHTHSIKFDVATLYPQLLIEKIADSPQALDQNKFSGCEPCPMALAA